MFSPKETASVYLKKIRSINPEAARVLEEADVRTDSEIQSLTQEDLRDLLPGSKNFKLRKSISEIIHSQKPINALLADMKDFIPDEAFRDALTENGPLHHYLLILKGLKDQMSNVQGFLDAHIDLLEKYTKNQDQTSEKGVLPGTSKSSTNAALGFSAAQTDANPSTTQACVPAESPRVVTNPSVPQQKVTVKCWSVVSGETFGCHKTLLNLVENVGDLKLEESSCPQDSQIIFVFCPISSQANADVKSAMNKTPVSTADKPVILVMMHHTYDANYSTPRINLSEFRQNIVLDVNIVYHDSYRGLLKCSKNNEAVSQMHSTLLQHCSSKTDGGTSSLDTNAAVDFHADRTDADPPTAQACAPAESPGVVHRCHSVPPQKGPVTVKFLSVVSGETLGAHETLLKWVENVGELKLKESSYFQDSQITFVFCPVSSRHLTDLESALTEIPADKPVILVMMYHTHNTNYTVPRINKSQLRHNIVLDVNVLFHESSQGLLKCPKNNEAVSQMHSTLLQHCSSKTDDGTSSLDTNAAVGFHADRTDPPTTQAPVTVKFSTVTRGQISGSHKTLLRWVEELGEVKLVESSYNQDSQITFVFCRVSSHLDADVKYAMNKTPADKPVILVMMYPTHNTNYTNPRINLSWLTHNIVLDVNVLFHEGSQGLRKCAKNDEAVSQIKSTLLQHCSSKTDGDVCLGTSSLDTNAAVGFHADRTVADPPTTQGTVTVKFWTVTRGQTFESHKTFLSWVENVGEVKLVESSCIQDSQITFVFCTINSYSNADVKFAMSKTPADKPVILVMMHHTRDANYRTPKINLSDFRHSIVLDVNILYHFQGLLRCPKNDEAVSQMHSTLLQRCSSKADGGGGFVSRVMGMFISTPK